MSANSGKLLRLRAELTQAIAERTCLIDEFVRQVLESDTHLIRVELLGRVGALDARVGQLLSDMARARMNPE